MDPLKQPRVVESADEFMEVSPDCVYVSVQSTSVVLQQQHAYIGASVWPAPGRDCRASQRYVDGQPVEFDTPCARTGKCVVDFIYCKKRRSIHVCRTTKNEACKFVAKGFLGRSSEDFPRPCCAGK